MKDTYELPFEQKGRALPALKDTSGSDKNYPNN